MPGCPCWWQRAGRLPRNRRVQLPSSGYSVESYAERLVCRAAYALYVWVVSVGVVGAFVPIEGAGGFPFAAIVGERFVVHEIAAYFEWSLAFCHVETYLVV